VQLTLRHSNVSLRGVSNNQNLGGDDELQSDNQNLGGDDGLQSDHQDLDKDDEQIYGWQYVAGAHKQSNGHIELLILWDNSNITLEDYRDEYWSNCSCEDLLDFSAQQQPVGLCSAKEQTHGVLDACNNGLGQIKIQYTSTKRGERGSIRYITEVHDFLSMEMITTWVFSSHHDELKSCLKGKT
jgi:hypothetical protein